MDENENGSESFQTNITVEFIDEIRAALERGGFNDEQCRAALTLMVGRNARIERLFVIAFAFYCGGKTLDEIGQMCGITRERVRQILNHARSIGIAGDNNIGGTHLKARMRRMAIREQKERIFAARIRHYFDMEPKEFLTLNDGIRSFFATRCKANMFFMQRRGMRNHGVVWNLNFRDWCAAWAAHPDGVESRGRGIGAWTLGRIDTNKPYEVGNIKIMRNTEISQQAGAKGWSHRRQRNESPKASLWERQDAALAMVDKGASLDEVQAFLGVGRSTASGYVCAARNRRKHGIVATEQSSTGLAQ